MTHTEEKLVPGVMIAFSETGFEADVLNTIMRTYMPAVNGHFDQVEPAMHYREYFKDRDLRYEAAGKPKSSQVIMEKSNPRAVIAFNQIVDELNAELPRIKEEQDVDAIKKYVNRARDLNFKIPEDEETE